MWGLLDWLISQLCLKGPHGGVATRRSAPWAAILTATQIKIPEAWQLPCQARTTQLAKHSSFRGKLKHSTVKLPGCLLTFITFFWSRTYFLWFSWAEFNSLPGSNSTLHSYATEWNMYGGLAESQNQNLIVLTHCRTPGYELQIAPHLWVLKAQITQWAAQTTADTRWRQKQGDKCSCRRSYRLINHPVAQLWIANSLPWFVCCGNPGCSPEASEQQSLAEKDREINEGLLYVLTNHLKWLPWLKSALKRQPEFLRHWSSQAAALKKPQKIWLKVSIVHILYISFTRRASWLECQSSPLSW